MIKLAPNKNKNSFTEDEIEAWKRETNWVNPCDKPKEERIKTDNYAWIAKGLIGYKDRVNTHLATNKYVVLVHIADKSISQGVRNYCIKQVKRGTLVKEYVKVEGFELPVVAYRKP